MQTHACTLSRAADWSAQIKHNFMRSADIIMHMLLQLSIH